MKQTVSQRTAPTNVINTKDNRALIVKFDRLYYKIFRFEKRAKMFAVIDPGSINP